MKRRSLGGAEDGTVEQPGLRVGLFSESFQPVQNGVTTSVLTLVAQLRSRGHHVTIFAPAHQRQADHEPGVLRFPSFETALNPGYPLAMPFLPRLAMFTHFERLRLDVVHTHTPFVLGLTGANLAISRGVTLVSTFHTLYSQYSHYIPFLPDALTQSVLEHYLPWYYNRCAEIICPSKVAEAVLRTLGVERPITVIPTGVPIPPEEAIGGASRRRERYQLGIPQDAPVLLYAGRLAREKNIELLLDVFARVKSRVPPAILLVAGGGPHAEDLGSRAMELNIASDVRFLGSRARADMDGLYAAADLFCFPSPSETQGLVVGEARAAGLPCVAVDAGGAGETILHGVDGLRVPASDPEPFAAAVTRLLTDAALRQRMAANARANARHYTPEVMADRVLALYRSAGGEPPRSEAADREALQWEQVGQSVTASPRLFDERNAVLCEPLS